MASTCVVCSHRASSPVPILCEQCGRAHTYVEDAPTPDAESNAPRGRSLAEGAQRLRLVKCGVTVLDKALGGFPPGSTSTVYGDAGGGKSTLSFRVCAGLSEALAAPALIVCPEMSDGVMRHVATKAGLSVEERARLIQCENPEEWEAEAIELGARVVLCDSVSKMPRPATTLAALIAYARRSRGIVLALAHMNNEGKPLGPVALRHDPDGVFRLELNRKTQERRLRTEKCRWGAGLPNVQLSPPVGRPSRARRAASGARASR